MIKAITGTKDILPVDISKWQYLEKLLRETFRLFNYKEIRTPIFEETALFARGIGEAIHHAYQGDLEFHYNPAENLLRVNWSR